MAFLSQAENERLTHTASAKKQKNLNIFLKKWNTHESVLWFEKSTYLQENSILEVDKCNFKIFLINRSQCNLTFLKLKQNEIGILEETKMKFDGRGLLPQCTHNWQFKVYVRDSKGTFAIIES